MRLLEHYSDGYVLRCEECGVSISGEATLECRHGLYEISFLGNPFKVELLKVLRVKTTKVYSMSKSKNRADYTSKTKNPYYSISTED